MKNPVGRPKKRIEEIRISKGYSLTPVNINFIAGICKKDNKKASEVLNNLLDKLRALVGE